MRDLTQGEILTLSSLIRMETNGLAVAKAAIQAINDEELTKATESGILASEGRIRSLQQFISENNITGEVRQ